MQTQIGGAALHSHPPRTHLPAILQRAAQSNVPLEHQAGQPTFTGQARGHESQPLTADGKGGQVAGLLQQRCQCLLQCDAVAHGLHAAQQQRVQLAQLGAACHSGGVGQAAAEFKPLEPPMWRPWRLGQGLLC